MLASLEPAPPLAGARLVFEPKYDGVRTLVEVAEDGIRLWSRAGNDKTAQFPEIVRALRHFARRLKAPVLLDGEIVALDERGEPAGFQRLQGRIHLTGESRIGRLALQQPVAFIAFDLLRDGAEDCTSLPLAVRRARLERVFGNTGDPLLRLSDFVSGDGRELYRRALALGWEGLIVKDLDSRYHPGARRPEWRKLKIRRQQECVVGGWTDPRGSRPHFGALLLGVWEGGRLQYVGHTGTGFSDAELGRLARLLAPLATPTCPFDPRPRTNERPHWVRPELVAEVAFTEWTADDKLRHPIYLGLRDDKPAREVRREPVAAPPSVPARAGRARAGRPRSTAAATLPPPPGGEAAARLLERLTQLEAHGGEGVLELDEGRLPVRHLDRVLWPGLRITKGDLMRYYVWIAPLMLPAVEDRPLVMRRFPEGVRGKAFYQQRAPARVPPGVRVESLPVDRAVPSRLIGGSLLTLLYTTQLAVISQDPWFSRVGSLDDADHAALDLDPMPGVAFTTVTDVARWIGEILERLGVPSVPKTSGAEGLHVYVPLPPRTSFQTARLFCELVATLVADRHPRVATVERALNARGRRVYVDYLQNARGKSLAAVYSVRATRDAGVSTPLRWGELDSRLDRHDFTLRTVPARVHRTGDLWAGLRQSSGADLAGALEAPMLRRRP
jgi:bifunctional non-homologous end joining protein LigD